MKMKYAVLAWLLLLPFSLPLQGATYKWPTIVGVDWPAAPNTPGQLSWNLYLRHMTYEAKDEELNQKPCQLGRRCFYTSFYKRYVNGVPYAQRSTYLGAGTFELNTGSDTWLTISEKLTKNTARQQFFDNNSNNLTAPAPECVFAGVLYNEPANYALIPWAQVSNHFLTPPGFGSVESNCITPPPKNQWCALATPEITFNFGTLAPDTAAGTQRSANLSVECTADINYKLQLLTGGQVIALSNGMTARLTAGGKTLESTLSGKAGTTVIPLVATLAGTPNSTGAFEGFSVLFVNYP
ncbi:hypothetical protein ACU63O_11755 [Klebsiella aerogenes]